MFKSIVVGTDGSDTAGQAVRQAIDLARVVGATLHVVSELFRRPLAACGILRECFEANGFQVAIGAFH